MSLFADDDAYEKLTELRELVNYLIEDYPCRLDHHGYCQDHTGGFRTITDSGYHNGEWDGERPECWNVAAKRALGGALSSDT